MSRRVGFSQPVPFRTRARHTRRWLALGCILALVMLFLLPMQMRAGADDPHPHALLHLILDARDGAVDHHADDGHASDHQSHAGASVSHHPELDAPAFGDSHGAAASWALLAALVLLFVVPEAGSVPLWPKPSRWIGSLPGLDPPPPRCGRS